MSTEDEVRQVVKTLMFEKQEDGQTYFGREVNRHIDKKFSRLNAWLFGGGVVLIVSATSVWVSNENRLSLVEDRLNNADIWTQTEQERYQVEVNRRFLELTDRFDNFEQDIRVIRRATAGY